MVDFKNKLTVARIALQQITLLAISALLLIGSTAVSAQTLDTIKPMGDWVEYLTVQYDGKPLLVHLRTGYQRAVLFPEPITLHSFNNIAVIDGNNLELPNCKIEIDSHVMEFSPLQKFKQRKVSVRGLHTGIVYELIVSSSSVGKRQPIQMTR